MAIVMGVLIVSFARLGHCRHLQGVRPVVAGQDRQHRNFDRAIPPDLHRPAAADRPPVRPSADDRIRRAPSASTGRCCSRSSRSRARRRRAPHGPRAVRRRSACGTIYDDPNFKGPNGKFDPARFQAIDPPDRLHRAALHRRAAQVSACAARSPAPSPPASSRRRPQIDALVRFQNEQRSIDYVKLDAAQAGTIEPPSPEALAGLFRRPQDSIPRARISQDRRSS